MVDYSSAPNPPTHTMVGILDAVFLGRTHCREHRFPPLCPRGDGCDTNEGNNKASAVRSSSGRVSMCIFGGGNYSTAQCKELYCTTALAFRNTYSYCWAITLLQQYLVCTSRRVILYCSTERFSFYSPSNVPGPVQPILRTCSHPFAPMDHFY